VVWIEPGALCGGVGLFVFIEGVVMVVVGWIVRVLVFFEWRRCGGGVAPRSAAPRTTSASPADVHRTRSRWSLVGWASLAGVAATARGGALAVVGRGARVAVARAPCRWLRGR
jgi:hypothetical protein